MHRTVHHAVATTGLLVATAGAGLLLAAPSNAASPTPTPTGTAVSAKPTSGPSSVVTTSAAPSSAFPTPVPSSTDPGSISVPAGNAKTRPARGSAWTEGSLIAGGLVLVAAGSTAALRRR